LARCWCFQAQAQWRGGLRFWGRTRVVELSHYDADRMHLWVQHDEPSLRSAMAEDNTGTRSSKVSIRATFDFKAHFGTDF
jgi:hypothetical protein